MTKGHAPRTTLSEIPLDDNLFVDMKSNRGSSTTIKTTSDNSSRHSNASTAPSSTDLAASQEDWRRKSAYGESPNAPAPPPKSSGSGFLNKAGRTFSFGGSKKNSLATIPAEDIPPVPAAGDSAPQTPGGRSRAQTNSTVATATPPKLEDRDFSLDLGGDLSNMLSSFNKRSSVATVKDESGRPVAPSRNLTGNRASQPSPLHLDRSAPVESPLKSWNSQTSHDGLLGSARMVASPPPARGDGPPPVPRHTAGTPGRGPSPDENEDTALLRDTAAATRFLSNAATAPRPRGHGTRESQDTVASLPLGYSKPSRVDTKSEEENMFQTSFSRSSKPAAPPQGRGYDEPQNKVMTPAEFEKYRQDKVRQSRNMDTKEEAESDAEEDNYEEEEDDAEKKQEMAKQRRKQEAHMTVYRQQMMKVTGEQAGMSSARPSIAMSMSTPNLTLNDGKGLSGSNSPPSEVSEDDDVPLGILAAHGFPGKNRPPTRLSHAGSNPNLRAAALSFPAGPGSAAGDAPARGGPLPAFARRLPQDPFLGAGLINQPPRESFAMGGGVPAGPNRAMAVGGLVGVIANEERQKAMRRGSPAIDSKSIPLPMSMTGGIDPMASIPPQMMYPMGMPQMPVMTPNDQAQLQLNQQMTQFMQMQMQFMQMMAGQNSGQSPGPMPGQMPGPMPGQMMPGQMPGQMGPGRPQSHMPNQSIGSFHDFGRGSFLGEPSSMGLGGSLMGGMGLDPVRGDAQSRTMSMVQPSSASWIQPPNANYAPSIRVQGNGYTPSIAPSERSNIGLPGRYRPVSSMAPTDTYSRTATMSGALPTLSKLSGETKAAPTSNDDDDDDEKGWEELKAKREKQKGLWKTKKGLDSDIGALIT